MSYRVVIRNPAHERAFILAEQLGLRPQCAVEDDVSPPVLPPAVFASSGLAFVVVTNAGDIVSVSDTDARAILRAMIRHATFGDGGRG